MILIASLLSSLFLVCGSLALWLSRRRAAEQRRFVCICTLVGCALGWVFAAVPATWLPEVSPTVRTAVPEILRPAPGSTFEPPLRFSDRPVATGNPQLRDGATHLGWAHVYVAGVGVVLLAWVAGWFCSLVLVRSCRTLPGVGSGSKWRTSISSSVGVPLCLGWPWRIIVLPAGADSWDESKLQVVLRHEEAHLIRRDHVWINLAGLLCVVQWINPLAWFLAGRLRLECEHAADDAVLRSGIRSSDYAEVILGFQGRNTPSLPLCALQPLLRRSGLSRRMEAILSPTTDRAPMNKRTTFCISLATVMVGTLLSGFVFAARERPHGSGAAQIIVKPAKTRYPQYCIDRRVELLQVGVKVGARTLVWDSNGEPVPENQVIEHVWYPDDNYGWNPQENEVPAGPGVYRHIVFRVQAESADVDPRASCEPATDSRPGPGFKEMNSQDAYLGTRDGWHYFMHAEAITLYVDRRKLSTPGQGLSNEPTIYGVGKTSLNVSVALTKPVDEGPVGKLPLFSPWTAAEYTGKLVGDQMGREGNKDRNSKVWSKVVFTQPNLFWSAAHFFTVSGEEIPDRLIEGWFVDSGGFGKPLVGGYYIGVPASEIGDVRMTTRKSVYVELSGIPMSPRVAPPH